MSCFINIWYNVCRSLLARPSHLPGKKRLKHDELIINYTDWNYEDEEFYRMAKDFFWFTDIVFLQKPNMILLLLSMMIVFSLQAVIFWLDCRIPSNQISNLKNYFHISPVIWFAYKFWHRLRECGTERALVACPLNIHFSEIAGVWDCKSTYFTHLDLITEHDCQVFCKSSYLFSKIKPFTMCFTFLSTIFGEEWDMLKFEAGLPEEQRKNVYSVKKNSWSFPYFEMTNAWW